MLFSARWPAAATAILFFIAAGMSPAGANWQASVEKDDFGDDHVGVAISTTGGRALGLRCENRSEPTLIFATRELWSDEFAGFPATLLIKVDDGEPESLPASLESYPMMVGFSQQMGVRVMAAGDSLLPLIEQIAKSKGRVAVALELAGKRFENTRFSTRGSRAAFKKIWSYCGSPSSQSVKPEM